MQRKSGGWEEERTGYAVQSVTESLVFGGCAFPPVSLGPAGDCPPRPRPPRYGDCS